MSAELSLFVRELLLEPYTAEMDQARMRELEHQAGNYDGENQTDEDGIVDCFDDPED